MCNLSYKSSKEIPVIFHNGSNCEYHLAEKLKQKFERLGENTEKYIAFCTTIQKCNEYDVFTTYYLLIVYDLWVALCQLCR